MSVCDILAYTFSYNIDLWDVSLYSKKGTTVYVGWISYIFESSSWLLYIYTSTHKVASVLQVISQ